MFGLDVRYYLFATPYVLPLTSYFLLPTWYCLRANSNMAPKTRADWGAPGKTRKAERATRQDSSLPLLESMSMLVSMLESMSMLL